MKQFTISLKVYLYEGGDIKIFNQRFVDCLANYGIVASFSCINVSGELHNKVYIIHVFRNLHMDISMSIDIFCTFCSQINKFWVTVDTVGFDVLEEYDFHLTFQGL